ncbi:hypothetical protein V496_00203, partial [Pseudogymnoascus sp. VKM F-4515 (FW-2607)]
HRLNGTCQTAIPTPLIQPQRDDIVIPVAMQVGLEGINATQAAT